MRPISWPFLAGVLLGAVVGSVQTRRLWTRAIADHLVAGMHRDIAEFEASR